MEKCAFRGKGHKGTTPAAGELASLQRHRSRQPRRGCGRWECYSIIGFAWLKFSNFYKPLYSWNSKQICALSPCEHFSCSFVSLWSSLVTRLLKSGIWTRYCHTYYVWDAMLLLQGMGGLSLPCRHPQSRNQAISMWCDKC